MVKERRENITKWTNVEGGLFLGCKFHMSNWGGGRPTADWVVQAGFVWSERDDAMPYGEIRNYIRKKKNERIGGERAGRRGVGGPITWTILA